MGVKARRRWTAVRATRSHDPWLAPRPPARTPARIEVRSADAHWIDVRWVGVHSPAARSNDARLGRCSLARAQRTATRSAAADRRKARVHRHRPGSFRRRRGKTRLFVTLILRAQQQRRRALRHLRQGGSDVDERHAGLGFQRFHDGPQRLGIGLGAGLDDRLLEFGDAQRVHRIHRRQVHLLDDLPRGRSMARSMLRSRGAMNRIASPLRPARPVRPMRCT
jgi:hypothetical protein